MLRSNMTSRMGYNDFKSDLAENWSVQSFCFLFQVLLRVRLPIRSSRDSRNTVLHFRSALENHAVSKTFLEAFLSPEAFNLHQNSILKPMPKRTRPQAIIFRSQGLPKRNRYRKGSHKGPGGGRRSNLPSKLIFFSPGPILTAKSPKARFSKHRLFFDSFLNNSTRIA